MNQPVNDGGDCKTAPATLGLIIIFSQIAMAATKQGSTVVNSPLSHITTHYFYSHKVKFCLYYQGIK